jgi:hypothetical protein
LIAFTVEPLMVELRVILLKVMVLPCIVENHMLFAIKLEVCIEELFVMVLVVIVLPCMTVKV